MESATSTTRPVQVLVADDSDAYLRAAVRVVGQADGFEIAGVALSGEEAVKLVAEIEPDLVLMDVRMPGLGGVEAARRIARLRPRSVVVLISDWPQNDVPEVGENRGAVAAVRKQCLLPALL